MVSLVFWLFIFGAAAVGWQAGETRDRQMILAILGAAALTMTSSLLPDFSSRRVAVSLVDVALLVIVYRYAMASTRHWPMWFAGIHFTGTLFNVLSAVLPPVTRSFVSILGGFSAIPAMMVLVIGLLADQRRGVGAADW